MELLPGDRDNLAIQMRGGPEKHEVTGWVLVSTQLHVLVHHYRTIQQHVLKHIDTGLQTLGSTVQGLFLRIHILFQCTEKNTTWSENILLKCT